MIIITGASKGVGRFLFSKFKQENIEVIGTYNSTQEGIEKDLTNYYQVDITDYKAV